jgi:hypothetical protein
VSSDKAMGRRAAVTACTALAVLLAWTSAAWPCSCARPDPAAGLRESNGAFVGTLRRGPSGPADDGARYEFLVERWLKGGEERTVTVHAPRSGASCGIEVDPGQRTGLLLDRRSGRWESGLCSQVDADELLAAAGVAPTGEGSLTGYRTSTGSPLLPVAFAVGGVGAVAAPVVLRRRRAR